MTVTRSKLSHSSPVILNYRGVSQSIPDNTPTPLELPTLIVDDLGLADVSSNFILTAPYDCILDITWGNAYLGT